MSEERLIDIESKLAYQDQLLLELNAVVTDQQAKIMQLETLCESLIDRVRAIAESGEGEPVEDQRPPHY